MNTDRIYNPNKKKEDSERSIRPKDFSEYVGQEKIKTRLRMFAGAAKKREGSLDHVLLSGPPGLGKTTLAHIISHEMGGNKIKATSGPAIEKGTDLLRHLIELDAGDIFFIDEIHRLKKTLEEILYPAMEDFQVDIVMDKKLEILHLNPFTLVGATTRTGLLTSSLRDRFGIKEYLEFYSETELKTIIIRSASILGIGIDEEGALEVAKRSRGTPRIANRILRRSRDYAEMNGFNLIDKVVADKALEMFEIDPIGLDSMDKKLILTIIDNFEGGPVGVGTLASCINEEAETLEDVYEPYLMQIGFIARTPRGRIATKKAFKYYDKDFKIDLNNVKLFKH